MRRSNRHTTCAARKSRLRTCDNDAAKRMGRAVKCPPLPCSNARLGGGDPDCRNVSPACGFGTPALPINFEGKDIVRAAFLAAAVHAGREDIFERDVSGLLPGRTTLPHDCFRSCPFALSHQVSYKARTGRTSRSLPLLLQSQRTRPLERTSQNRALPSEASEDDPNKAPPHRS